MSPTKKQSARRLPIAPFLLIAFIGIPLLEIAIFIQVGGAIGLGWTLALVVLTAIVGTWMLRQQGFQVLRRAQRAIDDGRAPVAEVFEGVCLLLAGALLLTPGFFTDGLGALLLLPPFRAVMFREVGKRIERRVAEGSGDGPGSGKSGGGPVIIDADFEEIDRDEPRNGPRKGGPMPPPGGGWGGGRTP